MVKSEIIKKNLKNSLDWFIFCFIFLKYVIRIKRKIKDPIAPISPNSSIQSLWACNAISLPCGFSNSGLPIGFQLVAPYFKEQRLLDVGLAFENATDWIKQPSL